MSAAIKNMDDLRLEIEKLRLQKQFKENEIKQHFNSPANIFNTLRSLFPNNAGLQPFNVSNGSSWLSRILLPLALNKTLFRKSNFIVKALVGLISQKVAPQVGPRSVSNIWGKLKNVIGKFKKDKPVPLKNSLINRT